MAAQKKVTEEQWDGIWDRYVTGLSTIADISREFDVPESTIKSKAKDDGWVRDLAAQVNAEAAKQLAQREAGLVSGAKTKALAEAQRDEKALQRNPNEEQIIGIVAKNQVNIVIEERKDVAIARSVATKLYEELSGQIAEGQKINELIAQVDELSDATYNEKTHLKKKLEHIIGFGGRVDSCVKLANALKVLIELERKVNKINDQDSEENAEKRTKLLVSFGK